MTLDEYRDTHPRESGKCHATYHARTFRSWAEYVLEGMEPEIGNTREHIDQIRDILRAAICEGHL